MFRCCCYFELNGGFDCCYFDFVGCLGELCVGDCCCLGECLILKFLIVC